MLILDEPTNHLDIPGKEALEESLKGFTGTILFVSHDRYFIEQLATGLLRFENGKAEYIDKTWDEYTESQAQNNEPETETKEVKENKTSEETRHQMSPDARRREIRKLEKAMDDKQQELEDMRSLRYEPEYYQDYQKMNDLNEDIDDIHNEMAHLEERWTELSEEEEAYQKSLKGK